MFGKMEMDWQIEEFMLYCRTRQLRKKTMGSYEQTLRLFERWCREKLDIATVDRISENVIRRYIADLQERGKYSFYAEEQTKQKNHPDRRRDFRKPISVTTINNYLRNIRVLFNWLESEEVIRKNPMKKVRLLKHNRQAKEYLSDEEMRKLISRMDKSYFPEHRDYVMIVLMFDTGMRLGECSSLVMRDVDLSSRRIMLRAEITKGRKDRIVYFSAKTETILRRWLQFKDRYVDTDYLFPVKRSGNPVSVCNFECNFKKYLARSSLNPNVSPHCLRNNFAKRCLMNGIAWCFYLIRAFVSIYKSSSCSFCKLSQTPRG
ncbi:MAG: tyrosine-type recombinase/integrase [Christensenellaceae bacterium]|nr:tyrosine-type recombinase/integrase [Christensenellaceae bacterium]